MPYILYSQKNNGNGQPVSDKIPHENHTWETMDVANLEMKEVIQGLHRQGKTVHHRAKIAFATVVLDHGDYINYWVRNHG